MPVTAGATSTEANLNATAPAAPAGYTNVQWQAGSPVADPNDPNFEVRDISAYAPNTGGVDARTTTTETIGIASRGKVVTLSNAGAIAVTLDSTVPNGFICALSVIGVGAATLTPSTGLINGAASLHVASGVSASLFFDGTNWRALVAVASGAPGGTGFVRVTGGVLEDPATVTLDTDGTLTANSDTHVPSQKAVKTFVTAFAPGGSGSLLLKTNGVSNGSQALLDLLAGLGIILTDDGSGNVTIAQSGFEQGGDGSNGALVYDGSASVLGVSPSISIALTGVNVSHNRGIAFANYLGTITAGINYVGLTFAITGFTNSVNNGSFVCVAQSASTLVLANTSAVNETHAATATSACYFLTRDIFASSITVNSGVVIATANCKIFCSGTLTNNNGTIHNNGRSGGPGADQANSTAAPSGSAGTNGSSATLGSLPFLTPTGLPAAGNSGGAISNSIGANSTGGGNGAQSTQAVVSGGAAGGSAGRGGNGGAGANFAGGTSPAASTGGSSPTAAQTPIRTATVPVGWYIDNSGTIRQYGLVSSTQGAPSGGSSGGGDTNSLHLSGCGGAAGGVPGNGQWLVICARKIVNNGVISSNGGDGGAGGNGGTGSTGTGGGGGGGGASGGNGGVVFLMYQSLSGSGSATANGGALGVHGSGGAGGTGGSAGSDGTDGVAGNAGVVIQLQC